MSSVKLLIVDDEESLRHVLKRCLRRLNCEIEEAENGKEGLEKFNSFKPDIILLDLNMPVLDGMEFLDQTSKFTGNTYRIVVFSGHADQTLESICFNKGAFKLLNKPCDIKIIKENLNLCMIDMDRDPLINKIKSPLVPSSTSATV